MPLGLLLNSAARSWGAAGFTWQIKDNELCDGLVRVPILQLVQKVQGEGDTAQDTEQEVHPVEDLLRCAAVVRHPLLDPNQLHLRHR